MKVLMLIRRGVIKDIIKFEVVELVGLGDVVGLWLWFLWLWMVIVVMVIIKNVMKKDFVVIVIEINKFVKFLCM